MADMGPLDWAQLLENQWNPNRELGHPQKTAHPMNRRQLLATSTSALLGTVATAAAQPLRVAVIGHTGRGNYGHGLDTLWLALPGTRIVAVADPDPAGLAAAVARLGSPKPFPDYRQMLADTKPDLVAVCPRHADQHEAMCLAAISAGVRGIYIEKPFCRTPAEADAIIEAAAKANTKIAIAHRNRYDPAFQTAKRLMEGGELGTILECRGRGKEDARGGALDFWVLGSHVCNLATGLGGDPVACSAMLYQDGRPCVEADVREGDEGLGAMAGNGLHARFELADGLPLFFDSVQNQGTKEAGFGLQVIGTKGILDFRIDRQPLVHFRAGNPFQPGATAQPWQPVSSAGIGQPEPIKDLAKRLGSHEIAANDLIAAIEEDRAPLCDDRQGRVTVEMACAIFASHRKNGTRIAWPLEDRSNPLR